MIGHLDCSTGVSGDKFLGALLDIGRRDGRFTPDHLRSLLDALAPEADVAVMRAHSHGIAATSVRVEAREQPAHRDWGSIRALLANAGLPHDVRDRALATFGLLAEAEAQVHGRAVDDVHFHEVGALDSILDVVGVCAGLAALGVERLIASPVAVGGGSVATSHGVLPVPAPATALLLEGIPTYAGHDSSDPLGARSLAGELTTPTGAALLRTCVDGFGPWPAMVPAAVGHGAGTRDIGRPNVCRLVLGSEVTGALAMERVTLLESSIDHISPEAAAAAAEQLRAEGALDVWMAPIVMKKGRAGFVLATLVPAGGADAFAERVVALTGTLGVRRRELERSVAHRSQRTVDTEWGPVRVKEGAGRVRPEADDIARIAREQGLSFSAVEDALGALLASEPTDA